MSRSLSSAAAVAQALGFARAEAALSVLETTGRAAVFLDRFGEVLLLNDAARRMLAGDVQIRQRRLMCSDRQATAELDKALHDLIWSSNRPSLLPPVLLPRRDRLPLLAYLSRPAGLVTHGFAACQAVIVLTDLEARKTVAERELARLFALTVSEVRLANTLLKESGLRAVADKLGIAYETARNVEKRILEKTGARNQAQLVGLLTRLAVEN